MSDALEQVQILVARFASRRDAYTSSSYNETQVRREFIDPLFEALGWDVANSAGRSEAWKEVIHEDRVNIEGSVKSPDYAFRLGGERKFLVEAKRPSVNLREDPNPAFQLKRYAWNAKLPISILTDFDELAIYDCRHKPRVGASAASHRVLYLKHDEYVDRWNEIEGIFSKAAVLDGRFDTFADSTPGARGTEEVDKVFLLEMESWREQLAKAIHMANDLTQMELNFAVQQTIDRIVFLRISEDRGIEPYGQLRSALSADDVYKDLRRLFQRADDRYNSGLFHFSDEPGRLGVPDTLTPELAISNGVLNEVISALYFPESAFDFSVMPLEILGQVYEQFLGKVIIAEGDTVVVEPKPEVRKAGGVYYTPTYIVRRIVEETVGPVLAKLNPRSAENLAVLDPASGSGSFLLVAYDFLLNWHLEKYVNSNSPLYRSRFHEGADGRAHLNVDEKRRILLNNIYGVDIDPQAVEVTKLSLLLRVLEDESSGTLEEQLEMFNERALPDLDNNIKCGNSLVGPDYFDMSGPLLATTEEREKLNAFAWGDEFPEIIKRGGFDAIVGNPPYIFTREHFTDEERAYYSAIYPCGWEKRNTYLLFMELLLRLLKSNGLGGYIVPNSWLTIESAHLVRQLYSDHVSQIADLNYAVFADAVMEPCIFIASGKKVTRPPELMRAHGELDLRNDFIEVDRHLWERSAGRFVIPENPGEIEIVDTIVSNSDTVGSRFDVRTGLQAYERGGGEPPQTAEDVEGHVFDRTERVDDNSYRYLQGKDVQRFGVHWSGGWMQYGPWLSQPRQIDMFTRSRVLLREITSPMPWCLSASFTDQQFLSNKSVITILHELDSVEQLQMLAAVLNSRVISLYYRSRAVKSARKIFPKVVIRNLREFPFPVDVPRPAVSSLLTNVEGMNLLWKEAGAARTPAAKTAANREASRLTTIFEQSVCALFGLSEKQTAEVIRLTDPALYE